MIMYSIINKSQLEGSKRLDAECYHPDKLRALGLLNGFDGKKISEYFMSKREIFNPESQKIEDAIVYDLTDTLGLFLEDGLKTNNQSEIGSTKKILKENDVIISRLRSYLKEISIVPEKAIPQLASTEFIVLRQKSETLAPETIFIFLLTDVVQKILEWSQEGTNHPRFSEDTLLGLRIPNSVLDAQEIIKPLIKEAFALFYESKKIISESEKLLLEELGLDDFEAEKDLFSVVNFSDIKEVNRLDAEYFTSLCQKMLEKIKNKNLKKLTDVIENIETDFKPANFPEKEFNYVELANIDSGSGTIEGSSVVTGKEAPGRAKRMLKRNDLVVSTVEGSLDKVALVNAEQEGFIASNGFFQFRSNVILPEVLLVLFKSNVMQVQLKQNCAGSILTAVPKESLNGMFIPVLSKPAQGKISELVKKSHESRKKAKELLEEAKRKVEEIIENY